MDLTAVGAVRSGENDSPAAAANNAYQHPASQEVRRRRVTLARERVVGGAAAGMVLLPVGGWRRGASRSRDAR